MTAIKKKAEFIFGLSLIMVTNLCFMPTASAAPGKVQWKNLKKWQQANFAGCSFLETGHPVEAMKALQEALKIARLDPGGKEYIATTTGNLAAAEAACEKNVLAEQHFKAAISMLESSKDERSALYGTLNNLAVFYSDLKRLPEAENTYKRLIALMEKNPTIAPVDVAKYLDVLSNLYESADRQKDAIPLLKRSLAIKEAAHLKDQGEVSFALSKLASVHFDLRQYKEAEVFSKRALALDLKRKDFRSAATAENNLAEIHLVQKLFDLAETEFKHSLSIFEKYKDKQAQGEVKDIVTALANLQMEKNKPALAEPLYRRALTINQKLYGENSADARSALCNLGNCLRHQDKLVEAENFLNKAKLLSDKLKESDYSQALQLNNIALLYTAQHKYKEAELLYKKAIAAQEKVVPSTDLALIRTKRNYADLLDDMDRPAEAKKLRDTGHL